MIRAVTANFACGSPSSADVMAARHRTALREAAAIRSDEVDLVFAQEIPQSDWLAAWESNGYEYSLGPKGLSHWPRSAIIWRRELGATPYELPTSEYHSSYIAAAEVSLNGLPHPVVLVSVHASPSSVTSTGLAKWDRVRERPRPRSGAGWKAGQLCDADMVLDTLTQQVRLGREVLAPGDYNECRAWDETHPGNWGRDFFENVNSAGLTSVTFDQWGEERTTSFGARVPRYQLDHILATPSVAARVLNPHVLESDERSVVAGDLSDHAAIRFEIE